MLLNTLCCYCLVAQSCPTLLPHGLQHARPPSSSPSPKVCPNSCSLDRWCCPAISSSDSSSSSVLDLSHHQGLLQWVICVHQMTKILELQLQHQSFQWIFRLDLPQDWLVWSPCCPRDFFRSLLQHHSSKASILWCSAFFTVQLSCDHLEEQSLDYTDLCLQSNFSAFQHTV